MKTITGLTVTKLDLRDEVADYLKETGQTPTFNQTIYTDMEVVVTCDGFDKYGRVTHWGDTTGRKVVVTGIVVDHNIWYLDDPEYKQISVIHNSGWDIYGDAGFEQGISDILGYEVSFTEQGMQQNGMASMEV